MWLNMMKIAYVINYISNIGPGKVVQNVIKNMPLENYDVYLITLFSGHNDMTVVDDLERHGIKVLSCTTLKKSLCFLGVAGEFYRIIDEYDFNVIHSHGIIPDILTVKAPKRIMKITTIHNNMFEDYINSFGRLKGCIYIKTHLNKLKKINTIVCCSKSVEDRLRKELKHERIATIYNGIETTQANTKITRSDLALPEDALVYIFAGNISEGKRVDWIVEKFVKRNLQNEYLLILGDGPLLEKCKSLANERVIFIGYTNDPIAYFNISDIYVSSSKSEGFSIAVLEALDNGLRLFLSDIPSHKEVIENSKVPIGVVFNDSNIQEMFSIIANLKIERQEIIKYKEDAYSAMIMTNQYIERYEKRG